MGLFDSVGELFIPDAPRCEPCKEDGRGEVQMRAGEQYAPRQGMSVSAWICPECDHAVMREIDGDVEMYDPAGGEF